MKAKILVVALLVSSCLTSWAWFAPSITQDKLDQIHIGQTTEVDFVHLFGPPDTRYVDLSRKVSDDWFRSVPAPIASYIPIFGSLFGGLNLDSQQLSVVFSPSGRVLHYSVKSSRNTLHGPEQMTTTTVHQSTARR